MTPRVEPPPFQREVNKRTFGKGRVLGCECTYSYTCGPCLDYHVDRMRLEQRSGVVTRWPR